MRVVLLHHRQGKAQDFRDQGRAEEPRDSEGCEVRDQRRRAGCWSHKAAQASAGFLV